MTDSLLPYPSGWYGIAESKSLKASQLMPRKIVGKDFVLFRTAGGEVCLMDAYCPHLGGNFGYGGRVEGETLVCPVHHFCFNTLGNCTRTGYGTLPSSNAIVKTYRVQEKNGFILFWFHPTDAAPEWEVPAADTSDWSEVKTRTFVLRAHPQEITENSVDLGHFSFVHHYRNVRVIKETKAVGPVLLGTFGLEREPAGFWGAASKGIKAEVDVLVYGLGYSFVEVNLPQMQMRFRQYVLLLPLEEYKTQLIIGISLNRNYIPVRIHPALQFVPRIMLDTVLLNKAFSVYANDVGQDFRFWENKVYVDRPALAEGDGPIGRYRRWAKQFYPNS